MLDRCASLCLIQDEMKGSGILLAFLTLSFALRAQPQGADPGLAPMTERLLLEEKHFVECLAYVYSPTFWISYRGGLYFAPKEDAQVRQIEALKGARAKYVALTNRELRHEIAARVLAASGLDENWQRKLLLPYSDSALSLTPTLNRPLRVLTGYKFLRTLDGTDALLELHQTNYLVLNFTGSGARKTYSSLFLIKEGDRAFATAPGEYQHVEAFTETALNEEEAKALNRVVAACRQEVSRLAREIENFRARQEFEDSRARATDNNPYQQFLLARCYLEGKGTVKDETLGLEWMTKAARNGSGDAQTYLAGRGSPSPEGAPAPH